MSLLPNYIIAIGASAGGLDELKSFFDHTPLDGVAYVIVQHLSPDFKSQLVGLLAKHSKLEIREATNGAEINRNIVYVIPHDKIMTVSDNRLHLTDKDQIKGHVSTINTFFHSLAADNGKRAIAVVLSGMGMDGTDGIRAIKKAGGMVIARHPALAAFPSMPSSAIASGMVDFILEPEAMPEIIASYVKHEDELVAELESDTRNLPAIIKLIKEQSTLDFTDYKQTTILRRIKRRAASNNITSLDNYLVFLKQKPEEVAILSKDFLIGVTSFFRDKEAFELLEKEIFPQMIQKLVPGEELKVWVAGCATGQEAYSIAMLLHELLPDKKTAVKIFATDIDTAALAYARRGVYNNDIVKHISAERIEKYFFKEVDHYRVKPALRQMVIFTPHDLVKNPPFCNMHFITCRNLLIYMTPNLQQKVFLMLLFGLKVDGYLFLGPSENPSSIIENLEAVNKKWKIYKNLSNKRTIRFDAFSMPEMPGINFTPAFNTDAIAVNNSLDEAVNISLVGAMDALLMCVDENNQVLKTYGDTSKYLLQKNFTSGLLDLLPKPLAIAYSTAGTRAFKTNQPVVINGIITNYREQVISVQLSATPLQTDKLKKRLLLVSFREDKVSTVKPSGQSQFDEKLYFEEYTVNLEDELTEVKDKLTASLLKLDASNENMQSFNEELLSANEEMQSTNEEMQSVNEELHTINTEYQIKNKELLEINDDLNNYFRSNINGQLFVNNELLLMKFSPGTVKLINLLPSDIGRPLSNISTNIKFETIIEDIIEVLKNGAVITKEIETGNGKWYQIMTMPYIEQAGNKSNGAVITFNDITQLKVAQMELAQKNLVLVGINADLDNFVHTASHDLLAPLANIEMSIQVMNKMSVVDPELNKFLTIINSSVKKFRSLVMDIGNVAKEENQQMTNQLVELEEIIKNVEWSLDDNIRSSGAVINKDIQVKHIRFSKKNLRSILYNLISNSIKFKGTETPVINVKTVKSGNKIILSVQDNGIGISADGMETIFNMHGRLHSEIDGQGIGLYLVKRISDASGGDIKVKSELGEGSTFSMSFKLENEVEKNIELVPA